jgi:hypothetical protein
MEDSRSEKYKSALAQRNSIPEPLLIASARVNVLAIPIADFRLMISDFQSAI